MKQHLIKFKNEFRLILTVHSFYFLFILFLAFYIFQSDLLSSLWGDTNDSLRYITNMLNPTSPPHPYHLLGTNLHYLVICIPLSLFFPSNFAITLAILLIQFVASLLSLYLLYFLFKDFFHLTPRKSLLLVFILYFIIISPYLLHATSEVLFLFYQLLAWTLLIQRRFFSAALVASITFALRFNGVFLSLAFSS